MKKGIKQSSLNEVEWKLRREYHGHDVREYEFVAHVKGNIKQFKTHRQRILMNDFGSERLCRRVKWRRFMGASDVKLDGLKCLPRP